MFSFLYISLFFVIFPSRGPETCFSCKTLTLQRVAILHFPLLFKTPPPHVDLFLTSCLCLSTSHIFVFAAQTNLLEVALPSAMVDRKQPHQVQVHGLRGPQQQGPSALQSPSCAHNATCRWWASCTCRYNPSRHPDRPDCHHPSFYSVQPRSSPSCPSYWVCSDLVFGFWGLRADRVQVALLGC